MIAFPLFRASLRPLAAASLALATLAAPLLLNACADAPQTAEAKATQATIDACRQHADDVYLEQNRDQLYQTSTSETPYSGTPSTGLPTRGLSARYAHTSMIDDCIRNTGTQTQRAIGSTDTPALPKTGPARPAPVFTPAAPAGPALAAPSDASLAIPPKQTP